MAKRKMVKFWANGEEVFMDLTDLTKKQIEKEFIDWLIEKADAGWEILGEKKKEPKPEPEDVCEDDFIPFDGNLPGDDYLMELWSE